MTRKSFSRRDVLWRTIQAAAGLGVGASALSAFGQSDTSRSIADVLPKGVSDLLPSGVCTLTCAQTLGPCQYDNGQIVRRDVTEGKAGLPTLLAFLVLDADTCRPIEDATVEIWHTDRNGIYSAPTPAICNQGDAVARTQTFLRGIQPTGADGWAYFNSIYPGWYPGRTTHIHSTITVNNVDVVTTQFYFADSLNEWVYRNHPQYVHRPNRSTTNSQDGVIGGNTARVSPFVFNSKLIRDRSLVAMKVVAVRRTRTTCNA